MYVIREQAPCSSGRLSGFFPLPLRIERLLANGTAVMWRRDDRHRTGDAGRSTPFVFAGLVAAVLLAPPTDARSSETVLTVKPLEPATTVWMLSAPHVGKKTCEVQASTPIRFITRARHGPHRYARVEVLEGDCAGEQGYVPWTSLEPKPQDD